ncbi:MAG: BrnT family toxin [Nitrospirae bacterium]|nr:BrnT family toxin [Nitrospirota bacterium]
MQFEWDEAKNRENVKRHGISFEDAKDVFDDPFHISVLDKRFDYFDERWITIGSTRDKHVIVIGHLYYLKENGDEVIRIITARAAIKKERAQYESIGK